MQPLLRPRLARVPGSSQGRQLLASLRPPLEVRSLCRVLLLRQVAGPRACHSLTGHCHCHSLAAVAATVPHLLCCRQPSCRVLSSPGWLSQSLLHLHCNRRPALQGIYMQLTSLTLLGPAVGCNCLCQQGQHRQGRHQCSTRVLTQMKTVAGQVA